MCIELELKLNEVSHLFQENLWNFKERPSTERVSKVWFLRREKTKKTFDMLASLRIDYTTKAHYQRATDPCFKNSQSFNSLHVHLVFAALCAKKLKSLKSNKIAPTLNRML